MGLFASKFRRNKNNANKIEIMELDQRHIIGLQGYLEETVKSCLETINADIQKKDMKSILICGVTEMTYDAYIGKIKNFPPVYKEALTELKDLVDFNFDILEKIEFNNTIATDEWAFPKDLRAILDNKDKYIMYRLEKHEEKLIESYKAAARIEFKEIYDSFVARQYPELKENFKKLVREAIQSDIAGRQM